MNNQNEEFREIRLGIVCPMANEKDSADRFIREVLSVCHSYPFQSIFFYAVVDQVSQDGTVDILKKMSQHTKELKVIYAPENKNVVDAYKRGYAEAIGEKSDWILEIDAGYSHNPSDIPNFFDAMINGPYDCVFGTRFSQGGRFEKGNSKRLILSLGGTWAANILLGTRLSDMTSGFELFKKEALEAILKQGIQSQGPFFQTEIRTFAHRFNITEVPIVFDAATGHVHRKALADALLNLKRLFLMRLKGELKTQ